MKISPAGLELIKQFEGFRAKAYQCQAGVWTIGYGTTKNIQKGDTITEARATALLTHDIIDAEESVTRLVKVPLNQNQFDALVSFVYNCGVGNFGKSTLLKLVNKGDFIGAVGEFPKWNKAAGKPSAGLTRRRQAEAALFMKSSDVLDMPQEVDIPNKPLVKSRTISNASIATAVGAIGIVTPVIEPAGQVAEIMQNNPQGVITMLLIALIAFGVIAMYIRYTDRHKL